MDFIALDFETANSCRESICSVGMAIVENGKVVKTVDRLVKPAPDYYNDINISVHGITPDMTEKEPTFCELWEDLKPYFDHRIMVAHNASFDFSVLRNTLDYYNIEYPTLSYYCSMLLSRRAFPDLINHRLPTVCRYMEYDNLIHHNAQSDAEACAYIMLGIFKQYRVNSFDELTNHINFSGGIISPDLYTPFSSCVKRKKH